LRAWAASRRSFMARPRIIIATTRREPILFMARPAVIMSRQRLVNGAWLACMNRVDSVTHAWQMPLSRPSKKRLPADPKTTRCQSKVGSPSFARETENGNILTLRPPLVALPRTKSQIELAEKLESLHEYTPTQVGEYVIDARGACSGHLLKRRRVIFEQVERWARCSSMQVLCDFLA